MLKRSSFELAIVTMAQHYNIDRHTLCVDNVLMPVSLFCCQDPSEASFGQEVISCLHLLASFRLTTTETALLSAYILLETCDVEQLFVAQLKNCLVAQLAPRYSNVNDVMQRLLSRRLLNLNLHFLMLSKMSFRVNSSAPPRPVADSRGLPGQVPA